VLWENEKGRNSPGKATVKIRAHNRGKELRIRYMQEREEPTPTPGRKRVPWTSGLALMSTRGTSDLGWYEGSKESNKKKKRYAM